jgi:hypothetical protein
MHAPQVPGFNQSDGEDQCTQASGRTRPAHRRPRPSACVGEVAASHRSRQRGRHPAAAGRTRPTAPSRSPSPAGRDQFVRVRANAPNSSPTASAGSPREGRDTLHSAAVPVLELLLTEPATAPESSRQPRLVRSGLSASSRASRLTAVCVDDREMRASRRRPAGAGASTYQKVHAEKAFSVAAGCTGPFLNRTGPHGLVAGCARDVQSDARPG